MAQVSPPNVDRKTRSMNMKKRLFAFPMVLFMASIGLAVTTAYQSGTSTQKAMKMVSGEIVSVDSGKSEVVVKNDTDTELRLMVNKATKITKEGKTISLVEMKPSEKVTCECEESTTGYVAKSIQVAVVKSTQ